MRAAIPSNLVGHARQLRTELDDARAFAVVSSTGGELFEIRYSGTILEEYGLIVDHEQPSLVIARALDTGEQIVLFDAAKHGYDAMFVEEFAPETVGARTADTVLERDGQTAFGVEVEVIDNIDWDDEEDDFRDDEGVIRLITGDVISSEQLRADGFDALTVTVITTDGTRHSIVEEELA